MKEHPILFMPEMVQAYLAGRKWQTRRIIRVPATFGDYHPIFAAGRFWWADRTGKSTGFELHCPYGSQGDSLWVKETWGYVNDNGKDLVFKASIHSGLFTDRQTKWHPSIFMPRRLSRISFPIVSIRPEIVQEISEADAEAEGIAYHRVDGSVFSYQLGNFVPLDTELTARERYKHLWNAINAKRGYSWDVAPWWVWVIEFPKYEAKL